ncbi:MAG TPA: hypothetical protein VE646_00450 [Actinomycetota bacterium]|jgi:hypothetical protein|nr:hypothetical protein [Actinomycetota bacterium]
MAQSAGFDMSRVSTATKILGGAAVLLLIDSFLAWQRVCVSFLTVSACGSANMWGGRGSFFGIIAGILTIVLIAWEAFNLAGSNSLNLSASPGKISAYLGFGVLAFVVVKFILALTNHPAFGAWIGMILALAVGYGAWMKFQEPETRPGPMMGSGDNTGGMA